MEYRGYTAEVRFDEVAEIFFGRVQHLRDVITFEADSVEGLKREFRVSVDGYLEFCQELGQEPERPYSGRFVLRLDPDLHRAAAGAAERSGVSLNTWCAEGLRRCLDSGSHPLPEREPDWEEQKARILRRKIKGLEVT